MIDHISFLFVYTTFVTFLPNILVMKFDPNNFHEIRILLGGLDIIYITAGTCITDDDESRHSQFKKSIDANVHDLLL